MNGNKNSSTNRKVESGKESRKREAYSVIRKVIRIEEEKKSKDQEKKLEKEEEKREKLLELHYMHSRQILGIHFVACRPEMGETQKMSFDDYKSIRLSERVNY